jgi:hypothetical protein
MSGTDRGRGAGLPPWTTGCNRAHEGCWRNQRAWQRAHIETKGLPRWNASSCPVAASIAQVHHVPSLVRSSDRASCVGCPLAATEREGRGGKSTGGSWQTDKKQSLFPPPRARFSLAELPNAAFGCDVLVIRADRNPTVLLHYETGTGSLSISPPVKVNPTPATSCARRKGKRGRAQGRSRPSACA